MTNAEYQKSRGTDHPFDASKAKAAWRKLNKEKIDARRKRDKDHKGKPGSAFRDFTFGDEEGD